MYRSNNLEINDKAISAWSPDQIEATTTEQGADVGQFAVDKGQEVTIDPEYSRCYQGKGYFVRFGNLNFADMNFQLPNKY